MYRKKGFDLRLMRFNSSLNSDSESDEKENVHPNIRIRNLNKEESLNIKEKRNLIANGSNLNKEISNFDLDKSLKSAKNSNKKEENGMKKIAIVMAHTRLARTLEIEIEKQLQ
jgi:hypothetical protein